MRTITGITLASAVFAGLLCAPSPASAQARRDTLSVALNSDIPTSIRPRATRSTAFPCA